MSHKQGNAESPLRWLDYARADLALAAIPLPKGAVYGQLCFHAQQAVEKAIKGVLLANGIAFPFTHNIQLLIDLIPVGISVPKAIGPAAKLSPYAVTTRYPGEMESTTAKDRTEAVRLATVVLEWAESIIAAKP